MGIEIGDLANAVTQNLTAYSDSVTEKIKKIIDDTAKEGASELGASSPRRTGKYAKGWAVKESFEDRRDKRNTVYNKTSWQLTHLLEFGHAKRGGGRVAGQSHIEPVEKKIIEKVEKSIREATGN